MSKFSWHPILLLCIAVATLTACAERKPQPVKLVLSEDSCSVCRMAVSQQKFAAEVVAPDGHVDYFDDLGCLVNFVKSGSIAEGAGLFVVDFNTLAWLDATAASYLWAKELPTPMSYGLAAFSTPAAAQETAKQWPGKVVSWTELKTEWTQ